MMNILSKDTQIIFDGSSDGLSTESEVVVNSDRYKIKPKDIISINKLHQKFSYLNPVDLSDTLGFKVTDFDGIKIFNGYKSGLKLHYYPVLQGAKNIILIFSFGESQSGRFVCRFEMAVS